MDINKKEIGQRIKMIRKELGLTMEEFGMRINGTLKSNVSKWERGHSLPNNIRLKLIADIGHITVEELLYGDDRDYINSLIVEIAKKYYKVDISSDEEFQNMMYNRLPLLENPFNLNADELYMHEKDFFDSWLLYPLDWDEQGMISFIGMQIEYLKDELKNKFLQESNPFAKDERTVKTYQKITNILNEVNTELSSIEIDLNNTLEARIQKEIDDNANTIILDFDSFED